MEFDDYLASADALRQTESAQGALLSPGQELDGLRVISFLGRGAASEVWRVRDQRQSRDYALKLFVLRPDVPEQARQRFVAEARALDEFRHPNLMRRYRLQDAGERPYFTMDVLRPLPERLSEKEIFRLLRDLLNGLEALHAAGIVHRDLKPSNVLIAADGRAVLADLGVMHVSDPDLARRLNDSDTPTLTLHRGCPFVGTPRYAAPEQLAGQSVTPATDFYSLGVVLEELFANRIPRRWRPLIHHMTAARPSQRPQSVRQLRRHILAIRILPWLLRAFAAAALAAATIVSWHLAKPTWIELSDASAEIITLGGGHYVQNRMRFQPIPIPPRDDEILGTNAIESQFQKMFSVRCRRPTVRIQGTGTLKCPDVVGCEIHLAPGVTFITSGRFTPDGTLIESELPPADTTPDSPAALGYPSYVIERGARLLFTDNAAYPAALITHCTRERRHTCEPNVMLQTLSNCQSVENSE